MWASIIEISLRCDYLRFTLLCIGRSRCHVVYVDGSRRFALERTRACWLLEVARRQHIASALETQTIWLLYVWMMAWVMIMFVTNHVCCLTASYPRTTVCEEMGTAWRSNATESDIRLRALKDFVADVNNCRVHRHSLAFNSLNDIWVTVVVCIDVTYTCESWQHKLALMATACGCIAVRYTDTWLCTALWRLAQGYRRTWQSPILVIAN